MNYYVYDSHSNRDVHVHAGSCRHCNEGKGKNSTHYSHSKDKWHGPYATLEEAQTFAKTLHKRYIANCGVCLDGKRF